MNSATLNSENQIVKHKIVEYNIVQHLHSDKRLHSDKAQR